MHFPYFFWLLLLILVGLSQTTVNHLKKCTLADKTVNKLKYVQTFCSFYQLVS